MTQKKIKVCVIGVGHMGEFHVQKYKSNSGVELVGVVDVNLERAMEIGKKYAVKVFDNYMDCLSVKLPPKEDPVIEFN